MHLFTCPLLVFAFMVRGTFASTSSPSLTNNGIVERLRYGIVFTQTDTVIDTSKQMVTVIFTKRLPKIAMNVSTPSCYRVRLKNGTYDDTNCITSALGGRILHDIRETAVTEVRSRYDQILQIAQLHQNGHMKRNIFGSLFHTLFGLSTDEQLNAVKKVVNELILRDKERVQTFEDTSTGILSVVQGLEVQMNSTLRALQDTYKDLNLVKRQGEAQTLANFKWTSQIARFQQQYSTLLQHLSILHVAIERLTQGLITPEIISVHEFRTAITDVNQDMSRTYPGYSVSAQVGEIYGGRVPTHFWMKNATSATPIILYIAVKIPVSRVNLQFHVFAINVFSVPLSRNSTDVSRLVGNSPYLAVSPDRSRYFPVSADQLHQCEAKPYASCYWHELPLPASNPSCELAIFIARVRLVSKLCDFRVQSNALQPRATEIAMGVIVFSKVPSIIETCRGQAPNRLRGCSYCVRVQKCGCGLLAGDFVIDAKITNCHNTSALSAYYPDNMAVLAEFFSAEHLQQAIRTTGLSDPLPVHLPEIKFNAPLREALSAAPRFHMRLSEVVKRAKDNKTLIDRFSIPNLFDVPGASDWSLASEIIPWISLAISIIGCVLGGLAHRKLRFVTLAMMMQHREAGGYQMAAIADAQSTSQQPPLVLRWTPPPISVSEEIPFTLCSLNAYLVPVILAIPILTLLAILIWQSKLAYDRYFNRSSEIIVELNDGCASVYLDVLRVTACPKQLELELNDWVRHVTIARSCLQYFVLLGWGTMRLKNTKTQAKYPFPARISISRLRLPQLRRILSQNYDIHFIVKHREYAFYMHADPATATCDMRTNKPHTAPRTDSNTSPEFKWKSGEQEED